MRDGGADFKDSHRLTIQHEAKEDDAAASDSARDSAIDDLSVDGEHSGGDGGSRRRDSESHEYSNIESPIPPTRV